MELEIERAAEFLSEELEFCRGFEPRPIGAYLKDTNTLFNPHEKEGGGWVKLLETKLNDRQMESYIEKHKNHWKYKMGMICTWERWLIVSPSDLRFKFIMGVI